MCHIILHNVISLILCILNTNCTMSIPKRFIHIIWMNRTFLFLMEGLVDLHGLFAVALGFVKLWLVLTSALDTSVAGNGTRVVNTLCLSRKSPVPAASGCFPVWLVYRIRQPIRGHHSFALWHKNYTAVQAYTCENKMGNIPRCEKEEKISIIYLF